MEIRKIQTKNILTKSTVHDGYTINPYRGCPHKCVYCYAEYMRNWTGHDDERWGDYVDVKFWEPLTEKQKEKLHGAKVTLSSATDPYMDLEAEFGRTHEALEELRGTEADILVITKSCNVAWDAAILKELNARVALSINTLDDRFRYDMDNASSIPMRLAALKALHDNGVYTVCFISPTFPGITDVPSIIEKVTGMCDEVWIEQLVLNYPYKSPILYYVKTKYPEFYPYYDRLYNQNDNSLWDEFDDYMAWWCSVHGFYYCHDDQPKVKHNRPIIVNQRGHKEFKERHRRR